MSDRRQLEDRRISDFLQEVDRRRSQRRFEIMVDSEPDPVALTGFSIFDMLARDPNIDPRFAALMAPQTADTGPLFTPEEEAAIEAQYAEEEATAQAERDRNEELADKRDAERARYGYGSGE